MCKRINFTVSAAQIIFKTEVAGWRFQGAERTKVVYWTKIKFSSTAARSKPCDSLAALQRVTVVSTSCEIEGDAECTSTNALTNTERR